MALEIDKVTKRVHADITNLVNEAYAPFLPEGKKLRLTVMGMTLTDNQTPEIPKTKDTFEAFDICENPHMVNGRLVCT